MAYSEYVKQMILLHHCSKKNRAEIARCLAEDYRASKVGICKFLRRAKRLEQLPGHQEQTLRSYRAHSKPVYSRSSNCSHSIRTYTVCYMIHP